MKWIKRLFFGLICLVLLGAGVYGGGHLLPAEARLEATASVDAEAGHVYGLLNTAEGLASWWVPAGKLGFASFEASHTAGPDAGVGLEMTFSAAGRTMGVQTIAATTPDAEVSYTVDYGGLELSRVIGLSAVGPITNITWTETTVLEDPMLRYLALFSESRVEAEIATVMAQLQAAAEPLAAAAREEVRAQLEAEKAAEAERRNTELEEAAAAREAANEEWEYVPEEPPTPIAYEPVE